MPAGQGKPTLLSKLSFVFVLIVLIPDLHRCPVNTWNHKLRLRGGILMEHSDKPRATDRLFLALPALPPLPSHSSPLQTGLGQTAGGAEEEPGHGT